MSPLPAAQALGLGVIAKRPLGNAPWRHVDRPHGHYAETYWHRLHTLALDCAGLPWDQLALRYAAHAPGVTCAIAGTASVAHLRHNAALVDLGPLPAGLLLHIGERQRAVGRHWRGEV